MKKLFYDYLAGLLSFIFVVSLVVFIFSLVSLFVYSNESAGGIIKGSFVGTLVSIIIIYTSSPLRKRFKDWVMVWLVPTP